VFYDGTTIGAFISSDTTMFLADYGFAPLLKLNFGIAFPHPVAHHDLAMYAATFNHNLIEYIATYETFVHHDLMRQVADDTQYNASVY
jgi:hypothetical protein